MYTLDANIFARDADPTDPLHTVCHDLLEALDHQQRQIIVPNLLLAEVAATVSRTRRDPIRGRLIAQAITVFEHVQLIPLDDALAQEAAEIAADRALRGADAVYVAVARRHSCALVSLDREQRERAAPVVLYIANWGSKQLAFRFPKGALTLEQLQPYLLGDEESYVGDLHTTKQHLVLNIEIREEEGYGSCWAGAAVCRMACRPDLPSSPSL